MANNEFTNWIGGEDKFNNSMNIIFNHPPGPSSELNAAATTRVGNTKGITVRARMSVFPRKSYLANRYAPGNPIINVRRVDRDACQKVKPIIRQVEIEEITLMIGE
jgi:hypothetical protein